ncbi:MAG: hypothetical protein M5U26_09330 [Planctomycetota bacterium]|nr:hypothetical protein [Planctomycetota bacterium]
MPRAIFARFFILLSLASVVFSAPVRAAQTEEGSAAGGEREVALAVKAREGSAARPAAQRLGSEDAAASMAAAALEAAQRPIQPDVVNTRLSTEGQPGDVRLVNMSTSVIANQRWIVPHLPIPPFSTWNKWLDENAPGATHCAIDWMDEQGRWWHTELRGYSHHPAACRVGEGEFPCSGVTVYGVFILPGRTDTEGQKVFQDVKLDCDYRAIEAEARKYARKDRRSGEPGTGGKGKENVGLGGPAFKPSQNSNTYIGYLLRKVGVTHERPAGAVGWDTTPHFPYSSNADAFTP